MSHKHFMGHTITQTRLSQTENLLTLDVACLRKITKTHADIRSLKRTMSFVYAKPLRRFISKHSMGSVTLFKRAMRHMMTSGRLNALCDASSVPLNMYKLL
jgi:hypothetical protein